MLSPINDDAHVYTIFIQTPSDREAGLSSSPSCHSISQSPASPACLQREGTDQRFTFTLIEWRHLRLEFQEREEPV